jgi:hypothetical protein
MATLSDLLYGFMDGWKAQSSKHHLEEEDKALRDQLDEDQVDEMVEESFPASDPPSTY